MLLADHLQPTLTRLEGELTDLRTARDGADKRAATAAEKRFAEVIKARDELTAFVKLVQQCAEQGPPPTDAACPAREADARYAPDLDDGVMINTAALWPLLTPQWKDPKKWWKELATAQGKKDYDWSHLAMRFWPTRVDAKCQVDPSLGVAHGCFWKYHPARAWAWELRLQFEIGPEFRIEERSHHAPRDEPNVDRLPSPTKPSDIPSAPSAKSGSGKTSARKLFEESNVVDSSARHAERDGYVDDRDYRAAFLSEHPEEALAAIEKEALRRRRKQKASQAELRLLEPGLWSAVPDACWQLELRLLEKQGSDFVLHSPDEAASRAAFQAAHPDAVQRRKQLLANLTTAELAFPDDDEEPADETDDESEENEEVE